MDATIVIPTKNAGSLFKQILDSIFSQKTLYTYEVICVDSGSIDGTVEAIKQSPATLAQIKPEEFGHGRTRNYGASLGTGDFICFLTQDALPADEHWLENMINAMKLDPQIAGGFGRHLPWPECNFIDKRDINGLFARFGDSVRVFQMEDEERFHTDQRYMADLVYFSDNNSCIRRSFWEQYPYPDVNFAEDQMWMRQMIEKGYKKVYCPDAAVYHSHNYDPSTYLMRYYDEYKALYEVHGHIYVKHRWKILPGTVKQVLKDWKYLNHQDPPIGKTADLLRYSARRNYARYKGRYLGGHYHEYSPEKQKKLDLKYSQLYRQIQGRENT